MRRDRVTTLVKRYRLLPGFVEIHHLDHVARIDSAEWTIAVARCDDISVGADDEFGGLNDLAAIFPPGTQRIGDVTGHAKSDREVHLIGNFLGLVDGIDASGDDFHAQLVKFVFVFCIADQLTATIGSPVAAIEQDDPIFCIEVIGQAERSATNEINRQLGEGRADAEFL
jgi:hypothetical protein